MIMYFELQPDNTWHVGKDDDYFSHQIFTSQAAIRLQYAALTLGYKVYLSSANSPDTKVELTNTVDDAKRIYQTTFGDLPL